MADPVVYERYRREPARKKEDPPASQRLADFLTFQMILTAALLAAVWGCKALGLDAYADVRRLSGLVLSGDPAAVSDALDLAGIWRMARPWLPDALGGFLDPYFPADGAPAGAPEPAGGMGAAPAEPPRGTSLAPLFLSAKPSPPVSGSVTSPFGWRDNPLSPGSADFHTGLDIAAPEGAPVHAALPGIVADTGFSDSYGNYILIDHVNGLQTFYCHCSRIIARQGEALRQGERIALVGKTGWATGAHVHFEVRQNSLSYDPLDQLL